MQRVNSRVFEHLNDELDSRLQASAGNRGLEDPEALDNRPGHLVAGLTRRGLTRRCCVQLMRMTSPLANHDVTSAGKRNISDVGKVGPRMRGEPRGEGTAGRRPSVGV